MTFQNVFSLRKHPFLPALRRWGRMSPAAKSEEKRMFSQAKTFSQEKEKLMQEI